MNLLFDLGHNTQQGGLGLGNSGSNNTINANIDFLKRAGFKDIMPISQYLSFIGLLAIK